MPVVDIIQEQDEFKSNKISFVLWAQKWAEFDDSLKLTWVTHRLAASESLRIPTTPGIYTLLIQPGIAYHPACSYLMYVGQTRSLRRRFGEYLQRERRETGRPKVLRLLNKYSDHVWFCYTSLAEPILTSVEDALLNAYLPPANDRYPAEISRVTEAF